MNVDIRRLIIKRGDDLAVVTEIVRHPLLEHGTLGLRRRLHDQLRALNADGESMLAQAGHHQLAVQQVHLAANRFNIKLLGQVKFPSGT